MNKESWATGTAMPNSKDQEEYVHGRDRHEPTKCMVSFKSTIYLLAGGFPGGSGVKHLLSNAGDAG